MASACPCMLMPCPSTDLTATMTPPPPFFFFEASPSLRAARPEVAMVSAATSDHIRAAIPCAWSTLRRCAASGAVSANTRGRRFCRSSFAHSLANASPITEVEAYDAGPSSRPSYTSLKKHSSSV